MLDLALRTRLIIELEREAHPGKCAQKKNGDCTMDKTYTIGELARIAGVSTKTLRIYEKKGLLCAERNQENRYRIYTEDAVRELEKIQLMKYLGFSLEQIEAFLRSFEHVSREEMLLTQKRMLERKRTQLDSVIACVDRAVSECKNNEMDQNAFLHSLSGIVKNQKADELVWRLGQHSDEPRGWSRFVFEQAQLTDGMCVMDAGGGYGNLWRYNADRLPKNTRVSYVDKHNTHADGFCSHVQEQVADGLISPEMFCFVWDDLEQMEFGKRYDRIFFNHVAHFIQDRLSLYRKFADALSDNGSFICTWGGYLLYENIQKLLSGFQENCSAADALYNKVVSKLEDREKELHEVFGSVERREYLTTLEFNAADEYMEYLLQMCKPAETVLEPRRAEFLQFLENRKDADGKLRLERDTYLFCCRREK